MSGEDSLCHASLRVLLREWAAHVPFPFLRPLPASALHRGVLAAS